MINYENLETPCFIIKESVFENSVRQFRKNLDRYFSKNIIGYSVKTNSTPYLLKLAKKELCYAEVVSYDEYNLALLCGFPKNRIIYNGPMKNKDTFLDAIKNGAIVNIETKREMFWLNELPSDKQYKVGIRLNINISKVSADDTDKENDDSRFGFSYEDGELHEVIGYIKNLHNIRLCGIHIHRTSKTRSVSFYKNIITYAAGIIKELNLNLEYIDIGGGYYGIMKGKPTFEEYSEIFYETLSKYSLNNLCIIVEPGSAIIASAFDYLLEVIDTKKVGKSFFITTNGTRNDIDPLYHKTSYIGIEIIKKNNIDRDIVCKQIVSGCTCLEFDRIIEFNNTEKLETGDIILFQNTGAYTMCLSPLFIRFFPKIYALDKCGNFTCVRNKWNAEMYVQYSFINSKLPKLAY
ncbi:diaminopimelate decarboxylase [uncultured Bacteroides sp.]|uniref:diaminopimelate decarboxylase n=1 Tax=uncultured Bacteroides sp. TaxID=162156 RepID=UPI00259448B6|nr:diaminopimelate decarboxylase [uncultured Bacteroides sp.]